MGDWYPIRCSYHHPSSSTVRAAQAMRCATRISRSLFKGADRGTGSPWCGTSIVRAVGAIHGLQVGTLDITGVSAGLQCTLSTSSFFSVDDDGGGGPAAPLLPSERAELHTPGVVAQPEMSTEGSVYIVHVVGPAAFVAVVAEVLSDDVLVDLAGRYHVEPYAYWRSGKHKCPTVRLSYDRLRRTEDSLRILRAPDNTVARQRRLYHAVFLASQP